MNELPLDPTFYKILSNFVPCFTAPSFENFVVIVCGWLQCISRRTITGMIEAAGVADKIHHERYHRFFSRARWLPDSLAKILFFILVEGYLVADEPLLIAGDDTLIKKTGPKVFGADVWRDGVLSTKKKTVKRWGLDFVVLGLVLRFPLWPQRSICFPLLLRLHRKQRAFADPSQYQSRSQLLLEMVSLMAKWLPERTFWLLADGAYANSVVVSDLPKNVILISRTMTTALLFDLPPQPGGKRGRGRPRIKGKPLAKPRDMVKDPATEWTALTLTLYGEKTELEVHTFVALWYTIAKSKALRFVLIRKKKDPQDWLCLLSTDTTFSPSTIIESFSARWSIEVAFYEAKQLLGVEQAQSRLPQATKRFFPLSMILLSLVKYWFLSYGSHSRFSSIYKGPWNRKKTEPAFSDMLAALRRAGWANQFFVTSASKSKLQKIVKSLMSRLARAS